MTMDRPPESSGLVHFDLSEVAMGMRPRPRACFAAATGASSSIPERSHWVSGEPGSGKSFFACAAIMDVVRQGERALVLDYEDSAATLASRLIALGAEELGAEGGRFLSGVSARSKNRVRRG